jgi:hypothetical protein
MGRTSYCEKEGRRIEEDSENPVNPAMVGVPVWCPLETEMVGEINADYKKEVKKIIQIVSDEYNPDALLEASHYLNKVIEDAKKKPEIN